MRLASAVAALCALPTTTLAADVAWTRDYVTAFRQAEERRAPVLIHFRGPNCGARTVPGATETRGAGAHGSGITRPLHKTELTDCDRMQDDVWDQKRIVEAAARFIAVLVDGGDQALNVRYQAVVIPTTLVCDPWGNEIFRLAGYAGHETVLNVLRAIPKDFAPLARSGPALREDGGSFKALVGAAAYYEDQGLRQVSERLYETALNTRQAKEDVVARRQAAISRGLNLLLMGRDRDAVRIFEKTLDEMPEGPGSDALLLGIVNAHLQGGRRRDAEAALRKLEKLWPGSPYTERARQVVETPQR